MVGLDLDFLTQIIDVQWEGGLAVEFTSRPDYLTMSHALSMNKVTLSFWFQVPKEVVAAVKARSTGTFWDYRVYEGVIPLISWGPQLTTPVSDIEQVDTGVINVSAQKVFIERIGGTHTAPLQPSGIGVYVGFAASSDQAILNVHIQTDVHASGTGLKKIQTDWTGNFIGINHTPPNAGLPIYANITFIETDVSQTVTEEPEYFGNSDSNTSSSGAGYPDVKVDEWNHLLISWELGSPGKMWCAINDENKNGADLPAMNDSSRDGPNGQWSYTPWIYRDHEGASVSVGFDSNNVPSNPFQIPAPSSAQRANNFSGGTISIAPIEKVELAELQIFSGVTLDTSSETNRRAFIDFERDDDGVPIRDEHGKRTLKPVNPKQAEDLLGKRPDILLHGSSDWQEGKNTGSLGLTSTDPPIELPGGQFKPTGEIKDYPGPEIIEA